MLYKIDHNDFDRMYSIMERSFPKDEFRDYESQKKVFCDPLHTVYGWKSDMRSDLSGFITIWELNEYAFAEHFAVDRICRNLGTGTEILRQVKSLYSKPICLEVEPPESDISRRRIEFYRRNGFYLNMYDYTQPSISEGRDPVDLLIMTTGSYITPEQFVKLRDEIMKKVYKVFSDK